MTFNISSIMGKALDRAYHTEDRNSSDGPAFSDKIFC